MRRGPLSALILLIAITFNHPCYARRTSAAEWMNLIRQRLEERDFLGARVLIRKVEHRNLPINDWYEVRGMVLRNPELGIDLILRGDRNYVRTNPPNTSFNLNAAIMQADQLMLDKQFEAAFEHYQQIARELRPRLAPRGELRTDADYVYPYVLQGMARALFGAKRFRDAWIVYNWIPQTYLNYRQVLFEKMWSSFKIGWVDAALGAIASQRSVYFSRYLEPEAYLIQVYLYKVLCRKNDLDTVLREIAEFKSKLETNNYSLAEWADSDLDLRVLLNLARTPVTRSTLGATAADRMAEKKAIMGLLQKMYASSKKRLLEDLTVAQAYANLAVIPGMDTGLKPIEKLPSRAALMAANLEIWPADSAEEWADEVGYHRFIGESLCAKH